MRRASREFSEKYIAAIQAETSFTRREKLQLRRALIWHGADIEADVTSSFALRSAGIQPGEPMPAIDWSAIDWKELFANVLAFIKALMDIFG